LSFLVALEIHIFYVFIMDLRQLETFARIAELKSFTKAADQLCLTQPTVSKQVLDLERYFDVKLIDRTKRSMSLTKAGEILFRYAKDFLSLKKETVDAIADFKGLKKGAIHIGASSIPGVYILPHILQVFKKQYNGIHIRLSISDTKDITRKMEESEIDIGFVGAKDRTKKLEFKKLLDDTIVIVTPSEYPNLTDMEHLKDYPFIMREPGSGTRDCFESTLKEVNSSLLKDLQVVAELTDTEAIKEAVKNGMGISYVSERAIKDELARGTVKILKMTGLHGIQRSFYTITKKGKTLLPQVKALMDIIDKWGKNRNP